LGERKEGFEGKRGFREMRVGLIEREERGLERGSREERQGNGLHLGRKMGGL